MIIAVDTLREELSAYVDRLKLGGWPGMYRYSMSCSRATLYSSTYAARILSLFGDIESLPETDVEAWADYSYGHPELSSVAGESGLFPTWFRLLALALIGKALPRHPLGRYAWHFDNCPGPQVWIENGLSTD